MAEAIFNHRNQSQWHARSAGSHPTGTVHPEALKCLVREGLSVEGLASKSWETLDWSAGPPDLVITLCDSAGGESCPTFLRGSLRVHWGLPDPARVEGPDQAIEAAFDETFRKIGAWVDAFFLIPFERWERDRTAFGDALGRIPGLRRPG